MCSACRGMRGEAGKGWGVLVVDVRGAVSTSLAGWGVGIKRGSRVGRAATCQEVS